MKKLTPILVVDAVEPCLPFWEAGLGFTKTVEVPDESGLAFVILQQDDIEVMLQSRRSIAADLPAASGAGQALLYLKVADLTSFEERLVTEHKILARRKTWYGATELVVEAPGGHIVNLAQHSSEPEAGA